MFYIIIIIIMYLLNWTVKLCSSFRYYGWQSLVVKDKILPYDFLPFTQTITKTKIYEVDILPNRLSNDDCQQFIDRIKPQLEDSLVFEYNRNRLVIGIINNLTLIIKKCI